VYAHLVRTWIRKLGPTLLLIICHPTRSVRFWDSTQLDLDAQALVDVLAIRWEIETFFEYEKDLPGSDHYQMMSAQGILRFWTLIACLMVFLEEQRALTPEQWFLLRAETGREGGAITLTKVQQRLTIAGRSTPSYFSQGALMPKLFLIHWDDSEIEAYADELRALGWEVEFEAMDGALAYRRVKEWQPDVVVIDLRYLPSHGRMTGMILRKAPATWEIPLLFVDGKPEDVEKTRETVFDAEFVSREELPRALEKIREGEGLLALKPKKDA